jgi:hypothetical protein
MALLGWQDALKDECATRLQLQGNLRLLKPPEGNVMRKAKVYPLDIWEAEGAYYSKGHHSALTFRAAMWNDYRVKVPLLENVKQAYCRVLPPDGSHYRFMDFCEPGPGAFPITYWEG